MGIPTTPDDQKAAAYYFDETTGLTTTVVRKAVPGGAMSLEIGHYQTTGTVSTAKLLYVAFNALSDSEEDNMLASVGQRAVIPTGQTRKFLFPAAAPLTRYCMKTDAATETAGSIVIQAIGSAL